MMACDAALGSRANGPSTDVPQLKIGMLQVPSCTTDVGS